MADIINFPRSKPKPVVFDQDIMEASARGTLEGMLALTAQSAADRAAGKLCPVMESVRAVAELFGDD